MVVWATMMTRDITFSRTFIGSHLGKTAHGRGRAKLEHYILLSWQQASSLNLNPHFKPKNAAVWACQGYSILKILKFFSSDALKM